MTTYVDHLLDGIAATTNSYANASSHQRAEQAIRRQTVFLIELDNQEIDGEPIDITEMYGTIDYAVDNARRVLSELAS